MKDSMIKLYQTEWCPYCRNVRMKLSDLGIDYITVNLPRAKADRNELFKVSRQRGIPTLVHGGLVIADDDEAINKYLEECYAQNSFRFHQERETAIV